MRQDQHQRGLVRAGIDLQLLGDADEAGVVVAAVLDVRGQALQAVQLHAVVRADGGHIRPLGLCHGLGGGGGVLAGGDLHAGHGVQELGALADGLGMGEDLLDVAHLSALLGHQVVVDLQPGGADDLEAAVAQHQVIDLFHRTGGAVFQGQHRIVAEAVLNGAEHALEGLEIHHLGVFEELLAGQLGVSALHALTSHGGRGGEQGLGVGNGPLDVLPQGGGLGVERALIAAADLKEHGPQGVAILLHLRGQLGHDVGQLLPLAGGVQGGQALALLLQADLPDHVHALGEILQQVVVDGVDLRSQFF